MTALMVCMRFSAWSKTIEASDSNTSSVTSIIGTTFGNFAAFIGNLLTVKASINLTGATSMEIGARVETEDPVTGTVKHTASAYLTFVALDENNRPAAVPPIEFSTPDEKRRHREALDRRQVRLAEKSKEKACREKRKPC